MLALSSSKKGSSSSSPRSIIKLRAQLRRQNTSYSPSSLPESRLSSPASYVNRRDYDAHSQRESPNSTRVTSLYHNTNRGNEAHANFGDKTIPSPPYFGTKTPSPLAHKKDKHYDTTGTNNTASGTTYTDTDDDIDIDMDNDNSSSDPDYNDPFSEEDQQAVTLDKLTQQITTILFNYLTRPVGGSLSESGANTAINRVVSYLCWAHQACYGCAIDCTNTVNVFQTFVQLHSDMPTSLEDYVVHLRTTIQQSPSTTLGHLDSLEKMFQYIYYYTRNRYSRPSFQTTWEFLFKKCRSSVRKERKVSVNYMVLRLRPCHPSIQLELLLLLYTRELIRRRIQPWRVSFETATFLQRGSLH